MSRAPARGSRLRAWLPPLFGVGIALALLLELSARLYLFGIKGLDPRRVDSIRGLDTAGFVRISPHPELGYELKPDLQGFFKLAPFRTNSRGLADRESAVARPPHTFRAVVVGSSFTQAAGVALEDAYHSRLEQLFSREFAPVGYEFINFGVAAYLPTQVLAMLKLRALEYDPDLVLFETTEVAAALLVGAGDRPFRELRPASEALPPFFRSFLLELWRVRTRPPPPAAGREAIGPRSANLLERRGGANVLEQLGALGRERHLPIAVVQLGFEAGEPSAADAEIERQCRAQDLYYVDTRPAFRGTRPRDFWIYELDPHPNAAAHEIFARVLAGFLRSNHLVGP